MHTPSKCNESELGLVKQVDRMDPIRAVPSYEDLEMILDKQKNGKAAGTSGILIEILKVHRQKCEGFEAMLTNLMNVVQRERGMWHKNGGCDILILMPKMGNLYLCDNCCGVALPNMVGKLLGNCKIVQIAAFG